MGRHFEHHRQPLADRRLFARRVVRYIALSSAIILGSLAVGVIGYHYTEGLPWLDSLLNASMILGGMGPVSVITTTGGKIFASVYSLFSGIVFLAVAGITIAPIAHRMLHKLHLAVDDEEK